MAEFFISSTNSWLFATAVFAITFSMAWAALELIDRSPEPMGRFFFGVITLVSFLALWLKVHVFWMVAGSDADQAGAVGLGLATAATILLSWGARRRAVDAYGSTGAAFLALVPFVALLLNFKGPAARETHRTSIMKFGRIVAFLGVAILITLIGSFAKVVMENKIGQGITANTESMPIERALKVQALIEEGNVPALIAKEVMLVGVKSDASSITFEYTLLGGFTSSSAKEMDLFFRSTASLSVCGAPVTKYLIERGASVVLQYNWTNPQLGAQVIVADVHGTACVGI
jgi:hypothetical protein